ncbi:hypothetical protein [Helicobacter macacae]|uniref:hypothetical protein n=1 Tax=Helicobacter macacae TaxID=398626 RepID=UPI0012EBBDFF|nr:hypothetical protein [Helicobacter macacae]
MVSTHPLAPSAREGELIGFSPLAREGELVRLSLAREGELIEIPLKRELLSLSLSLVV